MKHLLDIIIRVAVAHGLPKGALSYLEIVTKAGTKELFNHPHTSLIMISGVSGMVKLARQSGKPLIYGGTGQGPVFIERSAHLKQAIDDVIASKTFDNGVAPSAEHSLVLDAPIDTEARMLLAQRGAYFLSEDEADRLATVLFTDDKKRDRRSIGLSASELATKAGINVPKNTVLLMVNRKYVRDIDPYSKELLAPVLTCYTEDDWQNACEKCIELLIVDGNAHTLTIHSNDENVIEQFALKKAVARLLVNTPAAFGGMGFSTNLFPALTLGSASSGYGFTSDNVSPDHLIYRRQVAYGTQPRSSKPDQKEEQKNQHSFEKVNSVEVLQKILREVLTNVNNTYKA